jgi:hypothetical protein
MKLINLKILKRNLIEAIKNAGITKISGDL